MQLQPAFKSKNRGFIREGYYGDLVIVDLSKSVDIDNSNVLYKCGWSPLEGHKMPAIVTHTFVNGNLVYENGAIIDTAMGKRMEFDRK